MRECVLLGLVANVHIRSLSGERTGFILSGKFEFPVYYILRIKANVHLPI